MYIYVYVLLYLIHVLYLVGILSIILRNYSVASENRNCYVKFTKCCQMAIWGKTYNRNKTVFCCNLKEKLTTCTAVVVKTSQVTFTIQFFLKLNG